MSDFDPTDGFPSEDTPGGKARGPHPDWTEDAKSECTLFDLSKIRSDRKCWSRPPSSWKIQVKGCIYGHTFRIEGARLDYTATADDIHNVIGVLPDGVSAEIVLVPLSETDGAGERISSQRIRSNSVPLDFPIRAWTVAGEQQYLDTVREHLQWRRNNNGKFLWEDGTVNDRPEDDDGDGDPGDDHRGYRASYRDRGDDPRGYPPQQHGYGQSHGYVPQQPGYPQPGMPQPGYGQAAQWSAPGGYGQQPVAPPPVPGSPVPHIPNAVYGPVIPGTNAPSVQCRGFYLSGNQWLPVPPGFEAVPSLPPPAPGQTGQAANATGLVGLQPNGDRVFPNGLVLHPDGSRTLPDGTIVTAQGQKLRPDGTPIEEPKPAPAPPPPMDPAAIITAISSAVAAAMPLIRPAPAPAPDGAVEAARVKAEADLKLKMLEIEQARIDAAEKARAEAEAARIAREEQREKDRREKEDREAADRRAREEREERERKERMEREERDRKAEKKERDEAAWRSQMFAAGFIVGPDGSMRPLKEPREDKERDANAALLRDLIAKMERGNGKKEEGDLEKLVRLKDLLGKLTDNGGSGGGSENSTLAVVRTVIDGLSGPVAAGAEALKERVETQKIAAQNVAVTEAAALARAQADAAKAQADAESAKVRALELQLQITREQGAQAQQRALPQPFAAPQFAPPAPQPPPWTQASWPQSMPQQVPVPQQPPALDFPQYQPAPPAPEPLAPPPSVADGWAVAPEPPAVQAPEPDPETYDDQGDGGDDYPEGPDAFDDTTGELPEPQGDPPEATPAPEPQPEAVETAPEPSQAPAPPASAPEPMTLSMPFMVPTGDGDASQE